MSYVFIFLYFQTMTFLDDAESKRLVGAPKRSTPRTGSTPRSISTPRHEQASNHIMRNGIKEAVTNFSSHCLDI
ncbi:unnamed protein product [Hymenolepis diminuta]|uniref:Uncharacterized protein n=1 Tax=Hymenolepis diminuta TaxID=6216 RepID=A0A564XX09_HYMDI|nr:unnamed protein product [Hymenolepis diminuta]